MESYFEKLTWVNNSTYPNAENFNRMEDGIKQNEQNIIDNVIESADDLFAPTSSTTGGNPNHQIKMYHVSTKLIFCEIVLDEVAGYNPNLGSMSATIMPNQQFNFRGFRIGSDGYVDFIITGSGQLVANVVGLDSTKGITASAMWVVE